MVKDGRKNRRNIGEINGERREKKSKCVGSLL